MAVRGVVGIFLLSALPLLCLELRRGFPDLGKCWLSPLGAHPRVTVPRTWRRRSGVDYDSQAAARPRPPSGARPPRGACGRWGGRRSAERRPAGLGKGWGKEAGADSREHALTRRPSCLECSRGNQGIM